jgi:alpha-tubulin suppressor-like RCC1 family protein
VAVTPFSQSVTTDVNGAYTLTHVYGQAAPVTLIASKPGLYLDSEPQIVTVPPNAPGTDFSIGAPSVHVQPVSLDVQVAFPDSTNRTLTIANAGGAALQWTIRTLEDAIPALAGNAGKRMRYWNVSTNIISGSYSAGVYHIDVQGSAFDGTALWVGAGTILHKLDPLDGHQISTLDVSTISSSRILYGLAYDGTNLWFGGSTGSQSRVFAINPVNGQLVRSFPTPNNMTPDSIAYGGGILWMLSHYVQDVLDPNLYKLNPETGSVVGTISLSPTVDADHWLGGLTYFNGWLWTTIEQNGIVSSASLYKMNPANGAIVATYPNVAPLNIVSAMATDDKRGVWLFVNAITNLSNNAYLIDSGEAAWLRAIPDRGAVTALSTSQVTVAFDSVAVGPGVFHAAMNFASNDPLQPLVPVDVTFTVSSPISISGRVTLDGQPVNGATIQYTGPYAGSVLSDTNGNYSFQAVTGTYAIAASKANYLACAPATVTVGPSRSDVNFAFTTATISGTVRDYQTSAGVNGATVLYSGSLTGSVQTASDGAYSITRVYGQPGGTLTLTATIPALYNDSVPQTLPVPPDHAGIDFTMGWARIGVSPTSFDVTALAGSIVTQTLALASTGSASLAWSSWSAVAASSGAGNVARMLSLTTVSTPYGIAFDGTSLWVNNNEPYLYKVDPDNGQRLDFVKIDLPHTEVIFGLAWDGASLWVACRSTKYVYSVDRTTGAILKSIPMPDGIAPTGIAFGDGSLWVLPHYSDISEDGVRRIYRLDPNDGSVQGWIETAPGMSTASLYSLTYFHGALYVSEFRSLFDLNQSSTTFKLNPADGTMLSSFPSPDPQAIGLASDGISRLWVVNNNLAENSKAYLVDSGKVTWLNPWPSSGNLPIASTTNVALLFDATRIPKGVYTATLHVASNDRLHPDVPVTAVFHVINQTLLEADTASVGVPEGGTNSFQVRLSKQPATAITVTVARSAGDTNLTVQSGAILTFTTDNWGTYQTVVLAAAEDADTTNSSAAIVCSSPGVDDITITGTVLDNDTTLRVVADPGGVVSPNGSRIVTKGVAVPISAIANAGYSFRAWANLAGTAHIVNPNASNTTVTISVPTTILACFSDNANPSGATVLTWGYNAYGQLGDGTTNQHNTAVQAGGLSHVTAIAGGSLHSIALNGDGTVRSWGYNGNGQLGDGTTTQRNMAVQAQGISNITSIAAGGQHSVALKIDGTVWTWGNNGFGALGDGTTLRRTAPVQVSGLANVMAIAAGVNHTVALKSDGTVWAWGRNAENQLGDGTSAQRTTPVQVKMTDGSALSNVTAIAAGYGHTLAIKRDGSLWAWGYNYYGQLGDGTSTQRSRPVQVPGFSNVTAIAAGYGHSAVIKSDGTVWTCGYNFYGQLGRTASGLLVNSTFAQVDALANAIAVGAGESHTVVQGGDGTVWAWGWNANGQLGDGTTTDRSRPVQVPLSGVTAIAASRYGHTLALSYDLQVSAYEQWLESHFTADQLATPLISGDDADPDHDGMNNLEEYIAGTDPNDPASLLKVTDAFTTPANPGEFIIRWQSATGRVYTLQATTNLLAEFSTLTNGIPATPKVNVYTGTVNGVGQKFYRVTVE